MSDESVQAAKDQLFANYQTKADCAAAVQLAQANVAAANDALTAALNADSNAKAAIERGAQALQAELMQATADALAAAQVAQQVVQPGG